MICQKISGLHGPGAFLCQKCQAHFSWVSQRKKKWFCIKNCFGPSRHELTFSFGISRARIFNFIILKMFFTEPLFKTGRFRPSSEIFFPLKLREQINSVMWLIYIGYWANSLQRLCHGSGQCFWSRITSPHYVHQRQSSKYGTHFSRVSQRKKKWFCIKNCFGPSKPELTFRFGISPARIFNFIILKMFFMEPLFKTGRKRPSDEIFFPLEFREQINSGMRLMYIGFWANSLQRYSYT